PVVVDLAAPAPVLAAGGIADDRGLAAVLALGAAGALIGTRFQASFEALVPAAVTRRSSGAAARTPSAAGCSTSPAASGGRSVIRPAPCATFLDRWRGREDDLSGDTAAQRAYHDAAEEGDLAVVPVWASEATDLITALSSATDLVAALAAEAEQALARAANIEG
ncbi:MAG: nitronate monooxygenase, partial [Pseudonocardiaceae bacterium]